MVPGRGGPSDEAHRALDALRGEARTDGDRYETLQLLGEGGFARVYRARDKKLPRHVALKRLRTDRPLPPQTWTRFRREAEVLARLTHPNIVAVYDLVDDPPAIVMELVEGQPLATHMIRGLELRAALGLVEKVARAVHHAHGLGVVHRDLKPQNILVTTAFEPKVADFGIARIADDQLRLTKTGAFLGSPAYMSPEQALGELEKIDARSDVYALGAILHEVILGTPPFFGDTPQELVLHKTEQDVEAPRRLEKGVPREALAIALKALRRSREDRYPTAAALADDIGLFLSGRRPVAAARPWWLWLVGPVLALLALGLVAIARREPPKQAVAPPPAPAAPVVSARPGLALHPRRRGTARDTEEAGRHDKLAFTALMKRDAALAIAEATRVLELDAEMWDGWILLSQAEALAGNVAAAFDALDQGIAFFEERKRELAERPPDARGVLEAQYQIQHVLFWLHLHRAQLDWTRETRLIVADFETAKTFEPRSELRTHYARFFLEHEHDPRKALETLGETSEDWEWLLIASRVKLELHDPDGAIADATSSLARLDIPKNGADTMAKVIAERARARLAKGDREGALDDLKKAAKWDPTDERKRAVAELER